MSERRQKSAILGCLLLAASVSLAAPSSSEPQTAHSGVKKTPHHVIRHKSRKGRVEGQKAIEGDRVRQIQEALIREHYLNGEPSGSWDASTEQAMQRYQADHGWQTKTVPDSRALIRLGLGPDNEHLLNPESAMTTEAGNQSASSAGAQKPAGTPAPAPAVAIPASSRPASSSGSDTTSVPVH
jgi:peptidoglycan hydrolase-like protein with peptidoglycan-binding domain